MNIKDSYIHNGTAVLKDIKVESSVLKKILAGKDANDAYLDWETVCDLTGIKPTAAGTADKVGHKLTFSGGVTGDWDGSENKTVAIPQKSSWNYDDVYLKLIGGDLTGKLTITSGSFGNQLVLNRSAEGDTGTWGPSIVFQNGGNFGASLGCDINGVVYVGDNGSNKYKVYHANNLTIGTLMGSTAIGDSDEPVYWSGSAFTKCGPFAGSTHDHDTVYLKLGGGKITGPVTFEMAHDRKIYINNSDDETYWSLISFQQKGTEYGTLGTSGSTDLKWNNYVIYHNNNLTIKTLMGTTAIGDADEPVYWSGTAFVKAGAYPTKSSWNYDDVYLKDILLDTGNSTDKDKTVSLTNGNVYLKLFKTVNGAESEDSKVKIYGETNVNVTTDASGDIKITGVDSVSSATTATYASNVGASGTAGTNYVTAANVISMYNWYSTITASDAANNTAIDKWNEIIDFLASITDDNTLSGLLAGKANASHTHNYIAGVDMYSNTSITGTGHSAMPSTWGPSNVTSNVIGSASSIPYVFALFTEPNYRNSLFWTGYGAYGLTELRSAYAQKSGSGHLQFRVCKGYPDLEWNDFETLANLSDLSGYATTSHNHDSVYLKLAGGTLTSTAIVSFTNDAQLRYSPADWTSGWARAPFEIYKGNTNFAFGGFGSSGSVIDYAYIGTSYNSDYAIRLYTNSNPTVGSNTIWHSGNDGHESGLDADTLDAYQLEDILLRASGRNLIYRTPGTGGRTTKDGYTIVAHPATNQGDTYFYITPIHAIPAGKYIFSFSCTGFAENDYWDFAWQNAYVCVRARNGRNFGLVTVSSDLPANTGILIDDWGSGSAINSDTVIFSDFCLCAYDSATWDIAPEEVFISSLSSDSTTNLTITTESGVTKTISNLYASTAAKLSTVSKTIWGQTYWTANGVPDNVTGAMSSVTNIDSILYFDTTNNRLGVNTNSPGTTMHLYTVSSTQDGNETNLRLVSDGPGGDVGAIYELKGNSGGLVFAESNRNFYWRTGENSITGGGGTQVMSLSSAGKLTIADHLTTAGFWSGIDSLGLYIEGQSANGLRIQYPRTIEGNSKSNYDQLLLQGGELKFNSNKVWHAGNDGSGSGLDADTLDGNDASAFSLSGHTHSIITHSLTSYTNAVDDTTIPQTIGSAFGVTSSDSNAVFTYSTKTSGGTRYMNIYWTNYGNAGLVELGKAYGVDGRLRYRIATGWNNGEQSWRAYKEIANVEDLTWGNISGKPDVWVTVAGNATSYSLNRDSWTNTIDLPTDAGSYVLCLITGNSTLTGVFSIGTSDGAKDEISLHLHGNGARLFARTNGTKLQLSSNDESATSRSVTIKYKRMI